MKITKSRLLQIIREEVELHENNLEENTFELDESELEEETSLKEKADSNEDGKISKGEAKRIFDKEEKLDKETGVLHVKLQEKKDKRVVKDKYKGKTYKTSKSLAKVAKGKKHPKTTVAKAAASWADEPYAVAQATKIATTGTPKSKKKKITDEDKLFDPKTKKPINKTK